MAWLLAHGLWAQQVLTRTDGKLDFRFVLAELPEEYDTLCTVTRVEIAMKGRKKPKWVIPVEGVSFRCDERSLSRALAAEDVNFDGHSDIRILMDLVPDYRFANYLLWLYHPQEEAFVPCAEFSEIMGPFYNREARTISTGSGNASEWEGTTYMWADFELQTVLTESYWEVPPFAYQLEEHTPIDGPAHWKKQLFIRNGSTELKLMTQHDELENGLPQTSIMQYTEYGEYVLDTLFMDDELILSVPATRGALPPEGLSIGDLNFDGHADLQVTRSGDLRCPTSLCWLVDTLSGRYKENAALEELWNLEVNEADSVLQSSCANQAYSTSSKYRWENGQLVEFERSEYLADTRTLSTYRLVKGVLELIEEKIITGP